MPIPRNKNLLLARSFGLFVGLFSLVNLAGVLFVPDFDANRWWIDLHWIPKSVEHALLAICAPLLVSFGVSSRPGSRQSRLTGFMALLLGSVALINSVQFYQLLLFGKINPAVPVPLSLFIAIGLGSVCYFSFSRPAANNEPPLLPVVAGMTLLLLVFPVLQTLCFGKTDYTRKADVAVVFGARAYANGEPSTALADRVRTACELYHNGRVAKLVFSGGPGDGPIHETESMRRMALAYGVKPADILVDTDGLNTERTVNNSIRLFRQLQPRRVLAVSHFYHLPRIKMAYQRKGLEVYTVPAKESYFLRQIPYSVAREIAAFWAYYLRPLAG